MDYARKSLSGVALGVVTRQEFLRSSVIIVVIGLPLASPEEIRTVWRAMRVSIPVVALRFNVNGRCS